MLPGHQDNSSPECSVVLTMSIPEKMVEHLGIQGLRIVVDVREPDEYASGHVPGGRFVCSCPDDFPAARGTLLTEYPWPKPGTKYVGSGSPRGPRTTREVLPMS